ncbi:hypothetical protein SAMN05216249_111101 [Acetitomaculum ruminis DSM 5522]|uniref:FAR-17a/AIG1-like protein n=1 Tax=Acetitomaculum ruminis DSM 5522 TaxID=1120918 RepID=A0A1I0YW35_9FIRM|nr:hypothetical protein [Acetitomaculum ruminis]SFB17402.1 hypothetical protein SAMN05216249_111101 [Acetitomaculum ruminis DSM 5522]
MKEKMLNKISFVLNIFLIISLSIGIYYMFLSNAYNGVFATKGLANLKYFTVLSNLLCFFVAIASLLATVIFHKKLPVVFKLVSASEVGLTFVIIAFFLQPLYPNMNLYARGNLWFHLICPLIAMAEFIVIGLNSKKIPFKNTLFSGLLTLIYGAFYLGNTIINGIGTWPDSNDFYGFLTWGYPIGMIIFAIIVIMSWLISVILRLPNVIKNSKRFRKTSEI